MKKISLSSIKKEFPNLISKQFGEDHEISGFASVEAYDSDHLIFLDADYDVDQLLSNPPNMVVTTSTQAEKLSQFDGIGILICDDVRLAHALIRQRYDDHDLHNHEWPRIHPSAVVHGSVKVTDSVTIGPGVVLGRDVSIGERVVIQANSVIESDVVIGDDCLISARVFVGQCSVIGKRVVVKPGSNIGVEGFGFVQDENKHYQRVPHKGVVVIEDDVSIGSNCNVDRATYGETRISRGTKIDALCHIAHNVFVGEDCILLAQSGFAGSGRLGNRVIASGQTAVSDHITIVDDVTMVHRCGAVQDIHKPGMYASTPAQPFKDYVRNLIIYHKLYKLRRTLNNLAQQVKGLIVG